jgi:ABC-type branched-subunit amino acid transport system permease subunit
VVDSFLWVVRIAAVVLIAIGAFNSITSGRLDSQQWRDLIVFGVAQGSVYALIALGYTMVYGVLRFINFAHGEVFMIGAITGYFVSDRLARTALWDAQPFVALFLVLVCCMTVSALVALTLERVAYRPLRGAPRLIPFITAIGASFFLQYAVAGLFGVDVKEYPDVKVLNGTLTFLGFRILKVHLLVIVAALVMMIGLQVFVERSRTGRAMRAVAEDQEMARLMGVDVDRTIALVFGIGGAMAGAAGLLFGLVFRNVFFLTGFLPGIKAFTAAVLGGIGNMVGAVLGGLTIGSVESLGPSLVLSGLDIPAAHQLKDVVAFLALVLILIFRPTGILGERVADERGEVAVARRRSAPPAAREGELLPAREVDLGRALRLGLLAGLAAVFVSAIGMVQRFSEREIVGEVSLGTLLLVAIPLVLGYAGGRAPPQIEGFAAARPGRRNLTAGLLVGLGSGAVMTVFVLLIDNFDVRDVFVNISPDLVADENGPQLLTFGNQLPVGILVVLALNLAAGMAAGALHLLPDRWRKAVLAGAIAAAGFGLLQSLIHQLLRGIQEELNVLTAPLIRFLYQSSGALSWQGAAAVGLAGFGIYAVRTRPDRTPFQARLERLPRRRQRVVSLAILAVVALVLGELPQILGPFYSEVLNIAGIFLVMALGLNIVVGFAGMLDLGYVAFFAVGAYTTALITSPTSSLGVGWNFWVAVPFVVLAAAAAGLLVGTPVLRMRGDYLAIVTLGFGEIARLLFLSDWLKPTFGGAQGVTRVPDIVIGPIDVKGPQAFLYVLFALVLLAAYVSYALQDSRIGRAWMAMREDEAVAEAMGVNIVAAKLSAFIMGAILAGLGGALFATKIGSVFPQSFDVVVSITVLVVIIVGGMASVRGVVLGALVLVGLPELLREFEEYRFLLYGALLIFMMLSRPEGFIPSKRRAQELHEEELEQDAWLGAGAPAPTGSGS